MGLYDSAVWERFHDELGALRPGGEVFPIVRIIARMSTNDDARKALGLLHHKMIAQQADTKQAGVE